MGRFVSKSQPYCRHCGRPIPKRTETVWVKAIALHGDLTRYVVGQYTRIEELSPLVREEIVSVKRRGVGQEPRAITSFEVWDGTTYRDEFFCESSCAKALGYLAATLNDFATDAYRKVVAPSREAMPA